VDRGESLGLNLSIKGKEAPSRIILPHHMAKQQWACFNNELR